MFCFKLVCLDAKITNQDWISSLKIKISSKKILKLTAYTHRCPALGFNE